MSFVDEEPATGEKVDVMLAANVISLSARKTVILTELGATEAVPGRKTPLIKSLSMSTWFPKRWKMSSPCEMAVAVQYSVPVVDGGIVAPSPSNTRCVGLACFWVLAIFVNLRLTFCT